MLFKYNNHLYSKDKNLHKDVSVMTNIFPVILKDWKADFYYLFGNEIIYGHIQL